MRPRASHLHIAFLAVLTVLATQATRAATVSGAVLESPSGAPIVDARVTLFVPSLQYFFETRTNAQGEFAFSNLPIVDVWRLGACSLGREYIEIQAVVKGGTFQHTFMLGPETHQGQWAIIGNTLPEFFDATDIGILLNDGTIFYCHDTVDPIRFDPVTGQKTYPAGSNSEQGCMNATVLDDGRVIMVGGQDGSDPGSFMNAIPWVKTYQPQSNTWQQLEDMQHKAGRWYPGLARLNDGSLLVMGGGTAPSAVRTETCERFDLITETWTYTGSMLEPTEFPPSALLYNGKVLMTWSPPQLYDVQTGQWSATGNFVQTVRGFPNHSDHSICVLSDGRVLAIGVRKMNVNNTVMGEIYDPDSQTWSLTSNPDLVRFQTEMVPLPDGRVFVGGGESEANPQPAPHVLGIVKWCDLYDPTINAWRRMADMNWFREYHAVTMLVPDGRVVTTGGTRIKFQFGPTSADIEAFSPPYLFRGVRPQITSISTTTPRRGATITLNIAPQTMLTSVVLIGAPTTTHWVDAGIPRRLLLPVNQQGSIATVAIPTDANLVPLGHYMLFAMVDDIPSMAKIVRVRPRAGDVNGNGVVNVSDLLAVINAWGSCPSPCPPTCTADMNDDCVVNVSDLLAVINNWG